MGVQEMTRFGMRESDFDRLAGLIADVVLRKKTVASEVAEFRADFRTMRYCLTPEQTLRIAPRIFDSILPGSIARFQKV